MAVDIIVGNKNATDEVWKAPEFSLKTLKIKCVSKTILYIDLYVLKFYKSEKSSTDLFAVRYRLRSMNFVEQQQKRRTTITDRRECETIFRREFSPFFPSHYYQVYIFWSASENWTPARALFKSSPSARLPALSRKENKKWAEKKFQLWLCGGVVGARRHRDKQGEIIFLDGNDPERWARGRGVVASAQTEVVPQNWTFWKAKALRWAVEPHFHEGDPRFVKSRGVIRAKKQLRVAIAKNIN